MAQLKKTLDRIARQECLMEEREDITALAVPVFLSGRVVAAVGSFIPGYRFLNKHKQTILELLSALPEKIAERM